MKIELPKEKASRLINCGQLILVSVGDGENSTVTPCAWHLVISKEPVLLGIALAKKHYSSELIRKTKEFSVNVPDWSLVKKTTYCGSVSGRTLDKFKEAKLSPLKPHSLKFSPRIKECLAALECKLFKTYSLGDHYLFVGKVVFAEAEAEYFQEIWDTRRVELIFHLGARFFFKSSPYVEV